MASTSYELQSYFKSICNGYYIANEQYERAKIEYKETDFESDAKEEEYNYWKLLCSNHGEEIYNFIKYVSKRKSFLLITTKEEVFALLRIYLRALLDENKFEVISTDEEALKDFPKDELCQEFLKVYKEYQENWQEVEAWKKFKKLFDLWDRNL